MRSSVRAKFRFGTAFEFKPPPKPILIILKNGIVFVFPITKSRHFFGKNFKINIIPAPIAKIVPIIVQTLIVNGKYSFSIDV